MKLQKLVSFVFIALMLCSVLSGVVSAENLVDESNALSETLCFGDSTSIFGYGDSSTSNFSDNNSFEDGDLPEDFCCSCSSFQFNQTVTGVTKQNIGIRGGRITTIDGNVTLIIPEGALPDDTEISIQPLGNYKIRSADYLNNYLPVTLPYSLKPDGLVFKRPITIVIHYPDKLSMLAPNIENVLSFHLLNNNGTKYETYSRIVDDENCTIIAQISHFSVSLISINIGIFKKCNTDRDCDPQYKYFCIYNDLMRAEGTCEDILTLGILDIIPIGITLLKVCVWGWPFGGSSYMDCNAQDICQCFGSRAVYNDVDCMGPEPTINRPFFSNTGPQAKCEVVKEHKVNCDRYDKTYCRGEDLIFDDYYCDIECYDHGSVLGIGPVKKYCSHKETVIGKCDEPEPDVPPGNDRPDENLDVSTPKITSNSIVDPTGMPEVAVLFKGFPLDTQKLLASFHETVTFIGVDFPSDLACNYPILIIPTGGLYGLDSLPSFRSNLEQYVKDGGTLVVFSQQHGYEYSALPGGNLSGFGWLEDQSCHHSSVYINTYHPILSGQDSVTSDVTVDGYFTKYPENATVLLSRTKNGMPAMLMYEYGNGTVIASTIYTDWASTHYQATQDGKNLVRDMITWAKGRKEILEYGKSDTVNISVNVTNIYHPISALAEYPQYELGDMVNIPVNITNYANWTSDEVYFTVFNPDYNISYVNTSVSIHPNETNIINFTYQTTSSSKEGVYFILCLLVSNYTLIGGEYVGGFNLGIDILPDLYKVNFTLKDPDKNIVKQEDISVTLLPGEIKTVNFTYANPPKLGIWQLNYVIFDYNNTLIDFGTSKFAVSKYAENPEGWVYQGKKISFGVSTPDESVARGSNVPFTVHIWNKGDTDRNITVKYKWTDWWLHQQGSGSTSISVPAKGEGRFTKTVSTAEVRRQVIFYAHFYEDGSNLGSTLKAVNLFTPSVGIEVKTDKLEYSRGEDVSILLNAKNRLSSSYSTTATVRALDPDNNKIFEDSYDTTLTAYASEDKTFNFSLPTPTRAGTYIVSTEAYSSGNKVGTDSSYFNVPTALLALLVSTPEVFIPDTNTISFTVTNVGAIDVFNSKLAVNLKDPYNNAIWNDTKEFDVLVNESALINFTRPISAVNFGNYELTYDLSYEEKETHGKMDIPCSNVISLEFDKNSYRIRENMSIDLNITNTGRFLENLSVNVQIPDFDFVESWNISLYPDQTGEIHYELNVPETAEPGRYDVVVTNVLNNSMTNNFGFFIPESELELSLDKKDYSAGENLSLNIENRGGVDTSCNYSLSLYDPYIFVIYSEAGLKDILAGGRSTVEFGIPGGATAGAYYIIAKCEDLKTNRTLYLWEQANISGLSAALTSETDKTVYFNDETISILTSITNLDGDIINGTLNLKLFSTVPYIPSGPHSFESPIMGEIMHTSEEGLMTVPSTKPDDSIYNKKAIEKVKWEKIQTSEERALAAVVQLSYVRVSNEYIDIVVDLDYGTFVMGTTGGDPDNSNDDYQDLMYGWDYYDPYIGTSFTTVRIDGRDYRYGYGGTFISPPHIIDDSIVSVWEMNDIRVTQTVAIVTSTTGNPDTAEIRYSIENNDEAPHDVGIRVMIDTMLAGNDGAPFRVPHVGSVINEMEFVGADIPDYWMVFDSLTDPTIVGQGTLRGVGGVVPDKFVIAYWSAIEDTLWDYHAHPEYYVTWDSAVATWWNPASLSAGESRDVATFFGIGTVEFGYGELTVALTAPDILLTPSFTATALIQNNLNITANDVISTISLPNGLALGLGENATKEVGDLAPGAEGQATWEVWATGTVTGDVTYTVTTTSANTQSTTVNRSVDIRYTGIPQEYLIWEKNITVNVSSATNIVTNVSIPDEIPGVIGKLDHLATLYSNTSQLLNQSSRHSFYITDKNTTLTLETDKEIYKPDETITIYGEVQNRADITATNLNVIIKANGTEIYSDTFDLAPDEMYTFNTTYSASESFVLEGTVHGVHVADIISVEQPKANISVACPEVVGLEDFEVGVLMENTGNVSVDVTLNIGEKVTVPLCLSAKESKLAKTTMNITENTTLFINVSGDISQTIQREIVFGADAKLNITSEGMYPEGLVNIPYTVENTGILDTEFNATFSLDSTTVSKEYYIPAGHNVTDTLLFNLTEGEYTLEYETPFEAGNVSFTVATYNKLELNVTVPEEVSKYLEIAANVSNIGPNNFTGALRIHAEFYSNDTNFDLHSGENKTIVFNITIPEIDAGVYNATIQVLYDGNVLRKEKSDFEVLKPEFVITSIPGDLTFMLGENATMAFGVTNTGGAEGDVSLRLTIPGIFEEVKSTWIKPGMEEDICFDFIVPDDLEEKSYKVFYEMDGERNETRIVVHGANISVNANLDKDLYEEGETAIFTLDVTNECPFDLNLYARVKLSDYEEVKHFNLTDVETLQFDVPVHFNGQKLFYGMYMESGRALYLNAMYVHKKEIITLYTDKQVYNAGENVTILVDTTKSGTLTISAPGFNTSMIITGSTVLEFGLPKELRSGTYYIDYSFDGFSSAYPFDVIGYSARILECSLDKEVYNLTDVITVSMNVDVNQDISSVLKLRIYDTQNNLVDTFEMDRNFLEGENNIEFSRDFSTNFSGIHVLVYGVYAHSDLIFLASGAEYFDVEGINQPPIADANGPYTGFVGFPITFDGTGSYDPDGTIISYEWDLDDDGEFDDATGATLTKIWDVPYSGNISLRVTDDEGATDTDTTTLTVEEAVDTTPPTIESVTLDAYTIIPDAAIHVTVNATDNVGVTAVTADSVSLVETESIWEGSITAPSATGSYTLTIRAEDAAKNIAETTVDYSVVKPTAAYVDLTLTPSDITFSNQNPTVGETITINATIHNVGNATATNATVQLFDNGMPISSNLTITTINATETGTAQVNWTAIFGSHNISVIVDTYDEIAESNETNNIAFKVIDISTVPYPRKLNVNVIEPVNYSGYTAGDLLRFNVTVADSGGNILSSDVSAYAVLTSPDNESKIIPLSIDGNFFVENYTVRSDDPKGVWVANVTAYNSTQSGLSTSLIFFTQPYNVHVRSNKVSYVSGEIAIFDAEAYRMGVSGGVLNGSEVNLNISIYDNDSALIYGPELMNYNDTFQLFSSEVDTNLLGKGGFGVSVVCEDASGTSANTTTDIFVADDFDVDVSTDKSIYDRGERVNIVGSAFFNDGSAVDNATVSFNIDVRGFDRTFITQTDAEGRFNYSFVPFAYEAGNYSLRATVDYKGLERSNGTVFSINGLCLRPESETVDMAEDSVYVFNLTLYNLGENTLTGITAELVDQDPSDDVTGLLDTSTLAGILLPSENHSFALALTAGGNSVGNSAFSVLVSSDQTSDEFSEINVSVHPNEPALAASPRNIVAGLDLNESVIKTFTVSNTGYGTLRNVSIAQPVTSWLQLAGDEGIGDISPGENVSLNVVFSSFNVGIDEYSEFINISSSNHETVSLEVKLFVNDSGNGSLLFYVENALSRNVSGANISLVNELTFEEYNLTTDEKGYALIEDLPVGRYFYDIFGGNFTRPQMGSVEIEPMPEPKLVNITLDMSFIDFDWDVEPTSITDIYNIVLKMKFETDVPVPALVVHPSFLSYNFEPSGMVKGELYLINFGLVSIKDVKLQDVGLGPYAEMEFLVNDISEIKAKGSTQVPFKIRFSEESPRVNVLRGAVNIRGDYLHSVGGSNVRAIAGTNVPVIIANLDISFDPHFCVMCGGKYISPGINHQNLTLDKYAIAVLTVLNHDLDLREATNTYYINATNSNDVSGSDISFTPALGLVLQIGLLELLPDEILGVVEIIRERYSDSQLLIITQNLLYYERYTYYSYSEFSLFFRIPLEGIKNLEDLSVSLPHVDSALLGEFNPTKISPGNSSILTLNRIPLSAGLELPQFIGGLAVFIFGPPGDPNCLAVLPIGGVEVNFGVDIPMPPIPTLPNITWYWPYPITGDGGTGDGGSGNGAHIGGGFWFPSWVHIPSGSGDGDGDGGRDSDGDGGKPTAISRTIHEVVRLSISQNATMERDAFWAGLGVYNRMNDNSIDNLDVDIVIRDGEGPANDKFFVRSPRLLGISSIEGGGSIPARGSAKAQWLIIPKQGAGGTDSQGKLYNISANISYMVAGVRYELSTLDVQILVKPQPQIVLDYYIPSDVTANAPFKLAVKATNVGYGTARDFKISSAQPVIYDNAAGLMIDFKIRSGSESDLVDVNFGDLEPGESEFKWWEMVTTLDGTFTEFTGSYTHSPELGGMETSLIKELNTHIIMREIDTGNVAYDFLVDSDRNGIPDWVVDAIYGDSKKVHLVEYAVIHWPVPGNPVMTISGEKFNGEWICTSVEDPYENKVPILMVTCSDGRILSRQNYWMRDGRILIVDDPVQEYSITYETPYITPPIITNVTTTNITTNLATITWNTDEPSNSLVEYGIESGNYTLRKYDPENVTSHSVNLMGLLPNTTYYFIVNSTDRSGNSNESIEYNFTTTPLIDTTPPASITKLQNITGQTWINWTWTNPPDADFSHVLLYLDGTWQANTSNSYYNATGLTPETSYDIGAHTVDTSGNINITWVNQTTKTQAGIDTTPPSVTNPTATPLSIVADGIYESQLNVTGTDESGIERVTVDLSGIGGSSVQEMIAIPGTDVYTVNITAAVGTAPDTYELQVNAIDIYGNSNTSVSIALTVTEAEDTTPPIIESVTLDAYTTIPNATIHVTVNATDNVGVTAVTADGIAFVESENIWEGSITAPSAAGSYTLTIRAEDAAGNVAETAVDYSVVKPSGSIGIGVDPRLTTVSAGDTALITIKLVSTENFDDVAYVYLTTEGVYTGYEANLTWFNWTSIDVKVPAGAEVNVPLEVNIPAGESGYKMFYAKLESTKWTPTAMDTGVVNIV